MMKLFFTTLLSVIILQSFAATYTVTNLSPVNDDPGVVQGSLKWALINAAQDGFHTVDDINFDIQDSGDNFGVYQIVFESNLPIQTPVNINGYSQPGANIGQPLISFMIEQGANKGVNFELGHLGIISEDYDPSGSSLSGVMVISDAEAAVSVRGCDDISLRDVYVNYSPHEDGVMSEFNCDYGLVVEGFLDNNNGDNADLFSTNIKLETSVFSACEKGGVYMRYAKASLIENCVFGGNKHGYLGNIYGNGMCGMYLEHCDQMEVRNSTFVGNGHGTSDAGFAQIQKGGLAIWNSWNIEVLKNFFGIDPAGNSAGSENGGYNINIVSEEVDIPFHQFFSDSIRIELNHIIACVNTDSINGHGIAYREITDYSADFRNIFIRKNIIRDNEGDGIHVKGDSRAIFIGDDQNATEPQNGNNIYHNGKAGISLDGMGLIGVMRFNEIYCNNLDTDSDKEIHLKNSANNELLTPFFSLPLGGSNNDAIGTCEDNVIIDIYGVSDTCKSLGDQGEGYRHITSVNCEGGSFYAIIGDNFKLIAATATHINGYTSEFSEAHDPVIATNHTSLESSLAVYPNPTSNFLTVENMAGASYEISNELGVVLAEGTINEDYAMINLQELQPTDNKYLIVSFLKAGQKYFHKVFME